MTQTEFKMLVDIRDAVKNIERMIAAAQVVTATEAIGKRAMPKSQKETTLPGHRIIA